MANVINETVVGQQFTAPLGRTRLSALHTGDEFIRRPAGWPDGRAMPLAQIIQDDLA